MLELYYETHRRPGTRPANPDQPIRLTLGFAASEADRELVERLTVAMGARSLSQRSVALSETRLCDGG